MTKTWAPKVPKPRTVAVTTPPVPVRRMHVGAVDDPAEHEADAVAAHVIAGLGSGPLGGAAGAGTRIRRRAAVAPIGPDGGEVDEHVHRGIERNRGHGAGLDGDVRRSMEHAFGGADFGDVRIHAGAESAELNDRLGAQAFTVGRDIFLGHSAPAPTSPGGRHLLAHELAHTLQDGAGARRSVVRRLVWNDTLTKITSIKVLGQGASGVVAKVSDGGTPVFVKADQEMSTESIVAGNMLREGKFKSGKFQIVAPRTRLATPQDLAELKAKSARPDVLDGDPRDFVKRLDGKHGTVIAEEVDAPTLKTALNAAHGKKVKNVRHTRTGNLIPKTSFDVSAHFVDQVKPLVTKTAPIAALSKAMSVDLLMGMGDRVLGLFNAENFTFDPRRKQFGFIDNIKDGDQAHVVAKAPRPANPGQEATDNPNGVDRSLDSNLLKWMKVDYVAMLLTGDLDGLAGRILEKYTGRNADGTWSEWGIAGAFTDLDLEKKVGGDQVAVVRDDIRRIVEGNLSALRSATKTGLKSGRANVLKMLTNTLPLTSGLPAPLRREAMITLIAKRHLIKGGTDLELIRISASGEAQKLLNRAGR